jgi:hypothetical protein
MMFISPKVQGKKIRQGKFDLYQFMLMFFAPLLIIPTFYFLRKIILSNQEVHILYFSNILFDLAFMALFYIIALGNGIHSVSVILSKHMKKLRKENVWKINEFFHNAFSHVLLTAPSVLILFLYVLLEINHPNPVMLAPAELAILVICGLLLGIGVGIASTEGSIPRLMFYLSYLLSMSIPFVFIMNDLDFRYYPLSTLMEMVYVGSVFTLSFYKYKLKGFKEMVPHYFFDE